jgi:RiboL-PSP-HEPN
VASYTPVYCDLVSRLSEVQLLRRRAAGLERRRDALAHGNEIRAICRGAIVLLSSHVEAYVKEVGEHTLECMYSKRVPRKLLAPQFFYYASREQIEMVRDSAQPERVAEHVFNFFESHGHLWSRAEPLIKRVVGDDFNKGFSNPSFEKVRAYFGRFGYETYRRDFFQALKRDANTVVSGLDTVVGTRNSIAHGDPNATKTPLEVGEMIENSRVFCRTSDRIFANWCKVKLCTIR